MDRNLGALAASEISSQNLVRGTRYQFGRKDPFQESSTWYNISGKKITISTAGTNTLIGLVKNPVYQANSNQSDYVKWDADHNYAMSKHWNNPNPWYSDPVDGDKSLFDPCPSGWELPEIDVLNGILKNKGAYSVNKGYSLPLNGLNTGVGTAWYPMTMLRRASHSSASGEPGTMYSANPYNNNFGYGWMISSSSFSTWQICYQYSDGGRGVPSPVRCVQQ